MVLYRPLLPELVIKESKIDGMGLFAKVNIESGIDLGPSHIDTGVKEGNTIIRTPLGGFYNHSDTPNCERVVCNNECVYKNFQHWHLHTIKAIGVGEELTATYTLYDVSKHEEPYSTFNTDEGIE